MSHRVVVTGMSGITSLGSDYETISEKMRAGENGIQHMPDWEQYKGLNTKLGGPVNDFQVPEYYTRKQMRGMGRVSKMGTACSEVALKQAGLLEKDILSDGRTGVAYGSSTGSTPPVQAFMKMFTGEQSIRGITANTYIQMMPHTSVVNIGLFFKIRGRIIPTSSACTSGSQAIGYSYEAIKDGRQTAMVAGGGEELCPTEAAVFDTLFATSTKNDAPKTTPSPYDVNRDGLVIGEGAGTLILEELEHAQARGAKIFAEVVGFGTNCDAKHVTTPDSEMMQRAMELAIEDAGIDQSEIGYTSSHGTATDLGDIAETTAMHNIFGSRMPLSTMKSFFGHTLGACGAIEAWLAIEMMNRDWFAPTLNLKEVDSRCGDLDYIQGEGREINCNYIMSNNFGFGGINTSLIFKRWNA